MSTIGWHHTILDGDHGFRQTQTAISTRYLLEQGPTLAYETPVLGPPWSVPFEFPLYQYLVAALVRMLGMPIDETGRLVSVAFFLLTLVPVNRLLYRLQFTTQGRSIVLSLILLSPFYVFWSRTFLIESTALFFSMAYLAAAVEWIITRSVTTLGIALICGCLGALVKITTVAPVFIAVMLGMMLRWPGHDETKRWRHRGVGLLLLIGVPVVLALGWTRWADAVKELNQFGHTMTSSALWEWNIGTWAQRCSLATWAQIWGRANLAVGHGALLLVCALAMLRIRHRCVEFTACVLLYLLAPALFTNLHYVHEYYAYANHLFLVAAVGVCIAALLERGTLHRRLAFYLLSVTIALFIAQYIREYYPKQRENNVRLVEVTNIAARSTEPDDVILVIGCDWSSEIPYYSHRRALAVPNSHMADLEPFERWLEPLASYHIGAIIVRASTVSPPQQRIARRIATRLGLTCPQMTADSAFCVFTQRTATEITRGGVGQ